MVAVPQATPNESADTALVQVIPEKGQTAPSTAALVNELRDQSASLEKKYGVTDMLVTGPTAINIDVSDRLGAALLPFAAIVIGLSLVLLTIVFRSLAVPVKATLGYLLSVGAALGAVVLVFQDGCPRERRPRARRRTDRQLPPDLRHGRALRPRHGLRDVPGLRDA